MATMNGIDISSFQANLDLSKIKADFVIVKATEGIGYVNPYCDKHMQQAMKLGKTVGFYHYARPINDAVAEADYFYENTKGYVNKAIPMLDWEAENKWDVQWALRFLNRYFEKSGVRPMIYMSESIVTGYDWSPVVSRDYGLWVAKYRDNIVDYNYDMSNAGTEPSKGKWPFIAMWQWTSVGRLDGYDGNLDCNVFYGDSTTWNKYANNSSGTVSPSTEPVRIEEKPTADQVAQYIVNGTNGWKGVYGEERYAKLRSLGYDAQAVQQKVNVLMSKNQIQPVYYVIQSGDNLTAIANKYGTTWQKLATMNNIANPDVIYPGTKIRVK